MDDSFSVRVDKVFGSLSSSSSTPSPSLSSLWRLTDDEIVKREWNRDKESSDDEPIQNPSDHTGFITNQQHKMLEKKSLDLVKEIDEDLEDLDTDVDEDTPSSPNQSVKPDDQNDDEWEIRSSIGLDCTLDKEEEVDEYDIVAVVDEDRMYLTDNDEYGICSDTFDELPNSCGDAFRDPRANHMAAQIRLKEDAEGAGNFGALHVSDKTMPASTSSQLNTSTKNSINLKSILKKEDQVDSKRQKRVRFDPECKNDHEEESKVTVVEEDARASDEVSVFSHYDSRVPDYVQNPSKYTCYTLDSSEIDEDANRRACMDFLNLIKKSDTMDTQQDDYFAHLPKSVPFTPRKKTAEDRAIKISPQFDKETKGLIAVTAFEESEVCAMDEDEPETVVDKSNGSRKPDRQYRTKARLELDELIA